MNMSPSRRPRLLMVAFEFLPSNGSSVQRITSVYKAFINAGWDVDVLTASTFAYPSVMSPYEPPPLSEDGHIIRAFALDVLRHLSIRGKHLGWLLNPDRWGKTWVPAALWKGYRHIARHAPDLVWSSAPTPSPHIIASKLAKKSGAPWVADYRDPMPYLHRPRGARIDRCHRDVDDTVLAQASLLTFATEDIRDMYLSRDWQPEIERFRIMPNGFDEDLLKQVSQQPVNDTIFTSNCISFYYAGVLYADGRDPRPMFEALSLFRKNHPDIPVEWVFQGAGDGSEFQLLLRNLGLTDCVRFLPGTHYKEALHNMLSADALVLIQDEQFNQQIPGKVYEYLASERALWIKTPLASATGRLVEKESGVFVGYSADGLYDKLIQLVQAHLDNDGHFIKRDNWVNYRRDVGRYARNNHAKKLVRWSEMLIGLPEKTSCHFDKENL